MESKLDTEERNKLDIESFGIPSQRRYPLNDEEHVRAAIRMFNRVEREHERELAFNILNAMKKYKIPTSSIGKTNRLRSYL